MHDNVVQRFHSSGNGSSDIVAWLVRPPSQRQRDDEVLGAQVRQSFILSDRTYGARRVWHDMLAVGLQCGLHRIERLMHEQALRARPRRRGLPQDKGSRSVIADNCWTASFRRRRPSRSGWPTSLISGRPKAGCMLPWFWTCMPVASWAGRCRRA